MRKGKPMNLPSCRILQDERPKECGSDSIFTIDVNNNLFIPGDYFHCRYYHFEKELCSEHV